MCKSNETGSDRMLHPQTTALHRGYVPELSEGSLGIPIFLTSTFAFPSAEACETAFEHLLEEGAEDVYSRIKHPNIEIVEQRLTAWDNAEECALLGSGMAAIKILFDTFLSPADTVLHSEPLYGGTTALLSNFYENKWGVNLRKFSTTKQLKEIIDTLEKREQEIKLIFIETPANPTLHLIDIELCAKYAHRVGALLIVDNTFLGPLFQHPLTFGADIVVYSATKYISGHSTVVAGAILGSHTLISEIKKNRASFGGIPDPFTAWNLGISLETLEVRMPKQAENAQKIAAYLTSVLGQKQVLYLDNLSSHSDQWKIYTKECEGPGAMIALNLQTEKKTIFRFINSLSLFKIAVSLGGTHSLVCHPASSTHKCVPPEDLKRTGMLNLVRLSIGLEHPDDLIYDLNEALKAAGCIK